MSFRYLQGAGRLWRTTSLQKVTFRHGHHSARILSPYFAMDYGPPDAGSAEVLERRINCPNRRSGKKPVGFVTNEFARVHRSILVGTFPVNTSAAMSGAIPTCLCLTCRTTRSAIIFLTITFRRIRHVSRISKN